VIRKEGEGGITFPTFIRDISVIGLSFYTYELINLDSLIKISFPLSAEQSLSFLTQVKRVEKAQSKEMGEYIIGVEIEKIEPSDLGRLKEFLELCDIEKVLDEMNLENVTDIHFLANSFPMVKRYGHLTPGVERYFSREAVQGLLFHILDDYQYRTFQEQREINFIYSYRNMRFRVNLHFQQENVEGVFRIIPPQIKSLTDLGLPPTVEEFLSHKRGLVLIAGRTGSGKSTTLASMVEHINNTREGIVLCIEEPIEYVHQSKSCIIKQREVGRDTLSFFNATKNALRQNPDVLVIGEILEAETMEIALTAAESGALVLTTIHAPNSMYALDRVMSFFPPDLQPHLLMRLSLTLIGLITQELLPRKDEEGLVLASEILVVNYAMRRVIQTGDWKQIPTILQTNKRIGMQSMEDSLRMLCERGVISQEYLRDYYIK